MSAERLGGEGLWKRLLGDETVESLVEVQRFEGIPKGYLTRRVVVERTHALT